jgi:hypothetical protein
VALAGEHLNLSPTGSYRTSRTGIHLARESYPGTAAVPNGGPVLAIGDAVCRTALPSESSGTGDGAPGHLRALPAGDGAAGVAAVGSGDGYFTRALRGTAGTVHSAPLI